MKSLSIKRKYNLLNQRRKRLTIERRKQGPLLSDDNDLPDDKKQNIATSNNARLSMSSKRRRKWSSETMQKAIHLVRDKHMPLTQVSRKLHIPQSSLSFHLKMLKENSQPSKKNDGSSSSSSSSFVSSDEDVSEYEITVNEAQLERLLSEKSHETNRSWSNDQMKKALKLFVCEGKSRSFAGSHCKVPLSTLSFYAESCQHLFTRTRIESRKKNKVIDNSKFQQDTKESKNAVARIARKNTALENKKGHFKTWSIDQMHEALTRVTID
jgi:hypothetical protein